MLKLFVAFFDFIWRVLLLFFAPSYLLKLSLGRKPTLSAEQEKESIAAIRKKISRALQIVLLVNVFVLCFGFLIKSFDVLLPHKVIISFRFLGYSLILWGILSPVGWEIRTFSGDTTSEIMDEEWHRFNYIFGLFFLLLSYLVE